MAKKKKTVKTPGAMDAFNRAQQWKVVQGVGLRTLERVLEKWTGGGWTVFAVLGPFSDGFAVVLSRIVTL